VKPEAIRDHYDAAIGFAPADGEPKGIFAVVKRTYDLKTGALARAEPLVRNVWEDEGPGRLAPGSDFWIAKRATDVAIVGSAHLVPAAAEGEVVARVGQRQVRITVLGPRVARRTKGGRPKFEPPEETEAVPMSWSFAYGGGDPRVPVPAPETHEAAMRQAVDHPGIYPRNPYGRGYVVVDEPFDEVVLPQLEHPEERLTPERIITRDPAAWFRQPRSLCLALRTTRMFPRCVFAGVDPWFPAPEDERLPEVQAGELAPGYRREVHLQAGAGLFAMDPRFMQEAIDPLTIIDPQPGMPIEVRGMHPEGRVARLALPQPPRIEIVLEGRVQQPEVRPTLVVVRPDEARATVTWGAWTTQMHRTFIPRLHATIPLALRVDGDDPIAYVPPPTERSDARDEPTQR
jgi:hypothetical protein